MVRLAILRLLESYFRHRWLYLLPTVLMLAAGVAYVLSAPPVYFASGTLYVQQTTLLTTLTSSGAAGAWWITPAQATVNELRELLQTDAFVRAAVRETALEAEMAGGPQQVAETIQEFRTSVGLQILGDNLVMFSGTYEDPQVAEQIATATLSSYLKWKLNADNQESLVAQDFFAKILEPYQQELDQVREELRAYLQAHPEPVRGERPADEQVQISLLQSAVDQAAERVTNTKEKLEDARLAQTKAESEVHQNYAVVDAPKLPLRPATSRSAMLKSVMLFGMVGAMLTVGGIIGGAVLDRSLRFPIDARYRLDLPVLAIVPEGSGRRRKKGKDKVVFVLQINLPRRGRLALPAASMVELPPALDLAPADTSRPYLNGARDGEAGAYPPEDATAAIVGAGPAGGQAPTDRESPEPPASICLSAGERVSLARLVEQESVSNRQRVRAQILLRADERASDEQIAAELHVSRTTIDRTRKRYNQGGVDWALSERSTAKPRVEDRG